MVQNIAASRNQDIVADFDPRRTVEGGSSSDGCIATDDDGGLVSLRNEAGFHRTPLADLQTASGAISYCPKVDRGCRVDRNLSVIVEQPFPRDPLKDEIDKLSHGPLLAFLDSLPAAAKELEYRF
jgi:hypothetical protein